MSPPAPSAAADAGRAAWRRAGLTLAVAAVGLFGALPGPGGIPEPRALFCWLALAALPLGVVAGARGLRGHLALVALVWLLALLFAARRAGAPPGLLQGWGAATGLLVLGAALGTVAGGACWRAAALSALALGLLAALPSGGGRLARPWPLALAARALDLSPVTVVMESAGVAWTQHPANYDPVGTDSMGPDVRRPWRGARAAPALLALGVVGLLGARALARRRRRAPRLRERRGL